MLLAGITLFSGLSWFVVIDLLGRGVLKLVDFIGDQVMIKKVGSAANIQIFYNSKTKEIIGDKFVGGIKVGVDGELKEIKLQGVFVEIGLVPNSSMIDFIDKNKKGEIVVNNETQTSDPCILAAGDVTNVPEKQIIIAAGEGAKATLAAFKYLSRH